MRVALALVGAVVVGHLWLMLYAYAGGFEDLFLLGSIATAAIGCQCKTGGGIDG
jgi:hypothetical protein